MRQIQQFIFLYCILLYLQFFICNVFALNIDTLSKEKTSIQTSDTNDIMLINEWECSSNNDCTAKNSVCSNNLCQCASGHIFNADMTACVKVATGLYDSCEDTVQCSAYLLSGAKCVENVCVCGPGYYYLHGRCNQYVGLFEKCKQNVDCYVNADFEASTCDTVDRNCKCSPGFYQREYRTCRRKGKAVGDECTIDIDCTFGNATCSKFVCAIKSESDKAVELLSDIVLTKGIVDERTRVGSNCTTDEDCRVVRNAICGPTGTCRCDRAHFASVIDTECIPELGEPCRNDDVSYIEKSICREGRWSCTKGTVASEDNRECLEATIKHMGDCHLNEQCYVFGPDAVCNNSKCVCNESTSRYVESELFCWGNKGVGENCEQDRDCYVKDFKGNLTCNSICSCPDGTRLSKDKMACIEPTELGGFCEIDSDCTIWNSVCQKEVCSCAKNHYESNKHCFAGINSTCAVDKNCAPENSMCISQKCSCRPNYVAVAIDSCMPVSSYGEPCLLDVQCSVNTIGAICATIKQSKNDTMESSEIEDKVCTCNKEDYYRLGRCFKRRSLDESCTNLGECYASFSQERIICRNGKCACTWGFTKLNDSVCVRHLQYSKFFLYGGATNVMSTGLFSIMFLIFSSKLF